MASPALLERRLIPRGLDRTSTKSFVLWLMPWALLLGFGVYAAARVLLLGLNQTNLDNRISFGVWIFLDLSVIALGAGAFFTGFLVHTLGHKDLKPIVNMSVVLGFICYSGAMGVLGLDVGQPLRGWFTFWHPNVHSMLAEVTFCIACYLLILVLEYVPLVLRQRQVRQLPSLLVLGRRLHGAVPILAAVGTLLSFFHQGSLGGMFGVLAGRPFAFRSGFAIWPTTFFLFVLSAIAVGPSFLMVVTALVQKLSRRTLVPDDVFAKLAKLSGRLLAVYVFFKAADTWYWLNYTSSTLGFAPWEHYEHGPFGLALMFTEVVGFGLAPAVLLLFSRWRILGGVLACLGIVVNRCVLTLVPLAVPTLSFDDFVSYWPSWQEVGAFSAIIGYGVLVFSLSYRYLPLFPHEKESAHVSGS
jgi:molybdopterin-containing oxidoreductase family membrane subunit